MAFFSGKKQTRTAIIIKDHVIRYVHGKRPDLDSISSFGERYLPTGVIHDGKIVERETLEGILQECVEEWGLKKNYAQFLVPNTYAVLRNIQVPLNIKIDEIKGYLYTVIGETIHLPFDEPAFDVHYLGEKDGQREVLLIAAPENKVQQYVDLLQSVKLKANAADLSALSLYRLLHLLDLDNKNDHILIVEIDLLTINIAIFHNQKPVFMRNIKQTTEKEKWKLSNDLLGGVTWEGEQVELEGQMQDIITELERIMSFYRYTLNQGKSGVTKIVASGDHPYLQDIAAECSSSLGTVVVTLHNENIMTTQGKEIPQRYHELVGLALKKEVHDVS